MSYVKILVHVVWCTANHAPILTKDKRDSLFKHIKQNAREKNIHLDTIGGHVDHVHCLISLGAEQNIAKVVQLLKGESSFWANKEKLIKPMLNWAADYFADSVSDSAKQNVRDYINNQEEHHKKICFADEYKQFIEAHALDLAKASVNYTEPTSG